MVRLYTRASTDKAKKEVLQEFTKTVTHLRLIATTAFGLGIDCPYIKRIIHWGPPHTVEEYIQESGRAGRNNEQSYASLVYNMSKGEVSPDMIDIAKTLVFVVENYCLKTFSFMMPIVQSYLFLVDAVTFVLYCVNVVIVNLIVYNILSCI